jgi:hypothetical protein
MKKVLIIVIALGVFAACTPKKEAAEEYKNLITVVDFETLAPLFIDSVVTIEGVINHVCGSGGKMFLTDVKGEVKVKITAPGEEKIAPELEGKDVVVVGFIREQRVDEAYLADWEAKAKENSAGGCAHDGENHKHDESNTVDDHHDITPELEKINKLREQIAAEGKGYISFFSLEYQTVTLKEKPVAEEEKK